MEPHHELRKLCADTVKTTSAILCFALYFMSFCASSFPLLLSFTLSDCSVVSHFDFVKDFLFAVFEFFASESF